MTSTSTFADIKRGTVFPGGGPVFILEVENQGYNFTTLLFKRSDINPQAVFKGFKATSQILWLNTHYYGFFIAFPLSQKKKLDKPCSLWYLESMEKLTTLFLRKIDLQLKNDFKAICVKQGKTMTAEIQRLMRKEVEKEDKKRA